MRAPADLEMAPAEYDRVREYWDGGPSPRRLKHETEGLVRTGGRFEKHGVERAFFADGKPEFERRWIHGEPAGLWRAWWANGALRSECDFAPDGAPTEMKFWHENGALAAAGPAILGRRTGAWRFFREDGSLESEGHLVDGLQEGEWRFYDECERLIALERFARGVKTTP